MSCSLAAALSGPVSGTLKTSEEKRESMLPTSRRVDEVRDATEGRIPIIVAVIQPYGKTMKNPCPSVYLFYEKLNGLSTSGTTTSSRTEGINVGGNRRPHLHLLSDQCKDPLLHLARPSAACSNNACSKGHVPGKQQCANRLFAADQSVPRSNILLATHRITADALRDRPRPSYLARSWFDRPADRCADVACCGRDRRPRVPPARSRMARAVAAP
jgi:hypothetical protein